MFLKLVIIGKCDAGSNSSARKTAQQVYAWTKSVYQKFNSRIGQKSSPSPSCPSPFFFYSNNSLSFFTRFFIESPQRHQTEPLPSPKINKKKSRLTRDFTKLLFSTTCTLSASDVGCYVEQPASSTGKSLDKQAFSSTDSFIADSVTTTPSSQIAGLPIIFDDLDSSSSTSTSASPEAEYLLGQNNLDQEGGYSLTNNNMPNAGEFRSS